MSLFTSDRERHLWLAVLTVMLAIYATLGTARMLADALRERGLLQPTIVVVTLLVITVIIWPWVKRRPSRSEIGVALGIGLAYWLAFVRIENPAERTHLIEYGIVAALIHQALLERARNGRSLSRPAAVTVAVTGLLGFIDELIQGVLPSRVFDWNDVIFNIFAGFMVIVARLAIRPVHRPGWRLWFLWLMVGAVGWGWSMDPSLFGEPRLFTLLNAVPPVSLPLILNVATGGIVVGVLQWLVMRRYVPGAIGWVYVNLVAVLIGALTGLGLGVLDADLAWVTAVSLYGTYAGVLQWLVLRRKVARAGWWVPASSLGWLLAIPIGDLNGPPGWAVFGAVTGTVLIWLLRQSPVHSRA